MFIFVFLFILFLLGAGLPLALETIFSSDELIEMGVYLGDFESLPESIEDPLNGSRSSGPLCKYAGISA